MGSFVYHLALAGGSSWFVYMHIAFTFRLSVCRQHASVVLCGGEYSGHVFLLSHGN